MTTLSSPDEGEIRLQSGVRVAQLAQEVPQHIVGTVFAVVAQGLGDLGELLAEYHRLSHHLDMDGNIEALAIVQSRIESSHGWALDQRVTQVLTRLELPENAHFEALSGGMKRRVLLARALVMQPDVLLLDEPTNHLDVEAIAWMEEFLRGFSGSVLFITHDRSFLCALATRILEIDRGQVTSWPGDYDNYMRRREERLHAQNQANALFDKKLAQEEVWIRQGIKARRTRNEGRVRELKALRNERAQRRELSGSVRMEVSAASASGKRVIEAKDISFEWSGVPLVSHLTTVILRGDRVGIIGPNGAGKTTLLRLLLGQLSPQAGEVQLGSNLEIAYFDQHRAQLRDDLNALDNVAEGREYIEIGGIRKHVLGYLQDFLFSPERARAPITKLSGGERNRLLLAKLFAAPSNLLVMDEPTNDLDIETLELLEDLLGQYQGTLLLVSHDRTFIDNVVTSTLALEGGGRVGEYIGGYSDWVRQRPALKVPVIAKEKSIPAVTTGEKRKLKYKEAQELAQLPARIESLEHNMATLLENMPFLQDREAIVKNNMELSTLQTQIEEAYRRWEQLESEQ